MAKTTEYDYLLKLGLHGIDTHEDGEAINNRIAEWFATPVNTVADNPKWGHPLQPLKFEPESPDLLAHIKMAITRKLPLDVEDVRVDAITAEFIEADHLSIHIKHNAGNLHAHIGLRETGDVRVIK